MGLVEQLAGFSTEVAAAKAPLRPLLSTRNPYLWTADHDQAFEAVKLALVSPPCSFTSTRDEKLQYRSTRRGKTAWNMPYYSATAILGGWWMPTHAGVRTPNPDMPSWNWSWPP